MKRTITTIFTFSLFLFGITLFFVNCERESDLNLVEEVHNQRRINFLTEKELPYSILNVLKEKTNYKSSNDYYSKGEEIQNTIDIDQIMQVIDTLGNVNYSFRLNVEDNDRTTFFNLIINENSESQEIASYILKYKIEERFRLSWIESNYNFSNFTGKIYQYNLDDFFNQYESKESQNKGDGIDSCPCDVILVTGGTTTTTSVPTSSGSDSGGGLVESLVCTTTYSYYSNPCDGAGDPGSVWSHQHGETPIYEGGPSCSGSSGPITIATTECHTVYTSNKPSSKGDQDDCLDPCDTSIGSGEYGVLLPMPMSAITIANILGFEDGSPEYNYLETHHQERILINNYLWANPNENAPGYTPEAIEFGHLAVEAYIENFNSLSIVELINLLEFEQEYKNRMAQDEIQIFESISRYLQLEYLHNAQIAMWKAEELYPDFKDIYNGKGDAFRHAYWNGLNVPVLGITLAESLATAHENKPSTYNYSFKETQMDLFNNQVGRDKWLYPSDGFSTLEESILDALNNGELRYLNNLDPVTNRATNSSILIPTP